MKAIRSYPHAVITKKGERAALQGHPWVYDAEVTDLFPSPDGKVIEDGELIDVLTDKGKFIGTGFYNSHSKIRIRLISRNANDRFDESFWERKIRYAWEYRQTVLGGKTLRI